LQYKFVSSTGSIKIIYTKGNVDLMNRKTAVRPENPVDAVMGIAKWNLYFYFDLCKTQLL